MGLSLGGMTLLYKYRKTGTGRIFLRKIASAKIPNTLASWSEESTRSHIALSYGVLTWTNSDSSRQKWMCGAEGAPRRSSQANARRSVSILIF